MAAQAIEETIALLQDDPPMMQRMLADLLAQEGERDWLIDYLSPEGRVRLWSHVLH